MAKYTLLQIVQKVLSSVDGDEVNSISDTVEALQIAEITEDVFYNMVTNKVIPEHEQLGKLEALSDSDYPNYLKIADNISEIAEIRYNKATLTSTDINYEEVYYITPSEFIRKVMTRTSSADNVDTINDINNDVPLLIYNDRHPKYWTSFDDDYLVFDSYNSDVESTLQNSKTMVIVNKVPAFTKTDTFIPDIDDNLFPILINEVKAWAYVEHKQTRHVKAEQSGRKQITNYQSQRSKSKDANRKSRPDYGRR
jgi:hypothetical protein